LRWVTNEAGNRLDSGELRENGRFLNELKFPGFRYSALLKIPGFGSSALMKIPAFDYSAILEIPGFVIQCF
jgi:hypothetical protein